MIPPTELDTLQSDNAIYESLLRRLLKWDHFEAASDGAYWRREIEAALAPHAVDAGEPCPTCGKYLSHEHQCRSAHIETE